MADEYQRVTAARAALVEGLAARSKTERSAPRARAPKRRPLSDDEMLEAVFVYVRSHPGVTPMQVVQAMGYGAGSRSQKVTRPLARLHRLGRIERMGDGFRVPDEG